MHVYIYIVRASLRMLDELYVRMYVVVDDHGTEEVLWIIDVKNYIVDYQGIMPRMAIVIIIGTSLTNLPL